MIQKWSNGITTELNFSHSLIKKSVSFVCFFVGSPFWIDILRNLRRSSVSTLSASGPAASHTSQWSFACLRLLLSFLSVNHLPMRERHTPRFHHHPPRHLNQHSLRFQAQRFHRPRATVDQCLLNHNSTTHLFRWFPHETHQKRYQQFVICNQ